MSDRPSMDESIFLVAKLWASRSTCSRLQVGAVLARGGRVLSTGYNGAPAGLPHCEHQDGDGPCATAVHAEANALISAARFGTRVERGSLYVTHSPCRRCAGLIINSGISEVVYVEPFTSMSGAEMLRDGGVALRQWVPVVHDDPVPVARAARDDEAAAIVSSAISTYLDARKLVEAVKEAGDDR